MSTHVQEPALRCPVCRAQVVVKLQDEVVIHNAILKVDPPTGRVTAKCPRCKRGCGYPYGMSGDMTSS
jgi:hypothetical protein